MIRATTRRATAQPGLLAVFVVALVLGILGMHALSSHASASAADLGAHTAMSGTGSQPGGVAAAVAAEGPASGAVVERVATSDAAGSAQHGEHHGAGMVMLCAAMLAATAAATLLLILGLRRTPRLWAILRARSTTTRSSTSRPGSGPPPVWQFSVIRC